MKTPFILEVVLLPGWLIALPCTLGALGTNTALTM